MKYNQTKHKINTIYNINEKNYNKISITRNFIDEFTLNKYRKNNIESEDKLTEQRFITFGEIDLY